MIAKHPFASNFQGSIAHQPQDIASLAKDRESATKLRENEKVSTTEGFMGWSAGFYIPMWKPGIIYPLANKHRP